MRSLDEINRLISMHTVQQTVYTTMSKLEMAAEIGEIIYELLIEKDIIENPGKYGLNEVYHRIETGEKNV